MPERLAGQLEKAIAQQTALVEEVRTLQVSKRRMEVIAVLLLAVLIMVGGLTLWSRRAASNANEASRAVRAQTAATAEATARSMLASCQIRNGGFQAIRDAFTAQDQVWEEALKGVQNQAAAQAFLAKLRAAQPVAEKQDIDCDRDGKLGSGDYPPPDQPN
jgi:hypothetical protein